MKTRTKLLMAASAAIALGGLSLAGATQAHDWRGERYYGGHHHEGHEEHGGYGHHSGREGDWREGRHMEGRHMGGRLDSLLESFDTDKDGKLSQAEVDAVRAQRLAAFDANGDGKLSLEEYQALWLDAMRERMVDRFQELDDNGDAAVTAAEFAEPYAGLVAAMDRNGDGVISRDDFGPVGPRMGMGYGRPDVD